MCGILGFFDTAGKRPAAEYAATGRKMAAAIAHRGPDDEGLWQDQTHPLVLAQRRLSIIDLSPEGHQPMISHSGRYIIIFNGEIYNFPELRQELEPFNIPWRGRSDTEIMLAAFDQWGVNRALQKMNGMFAFVLWDRKTAQLHFARDRLGKKPLYVGWAGKMLVFGSELKALRAHPDFAPSVNRGALNLFMHYTYVPAPHTIYDGVWQILPGARMTLDVAALKPGEPLLSRMESYWPLPRVVEDARRRRYPYNDEAAITEFEDLLTECVRDRMISDVPLGAFLSGGIDSSAVVALMQKISNTPVKTFCIGFREDGFDEAGHARAVAQHLGTEHHELYLSPQDALNIIPSLPDMYDEPFADHSQIPTYLVSRFARQHVTVALSGDGGDEMLAGYLRHFAVPAFWKRVGWMPVPARRALAALIRTRPPAHWNRLAPHQPRLGEKLYKLADILPAAGAEDLYDRLVSQWAYDEDMVPGAPVPSIPLRDPAWQAPGLNFTERMMYGDALSYLPGDILVKVDRASMAASLEARAPLLDMRIFEYAWSLPLSLKVRDGEGKWLLRQVLARHVPRDLFERPKQGFGVPVAAWLSGPLKGWADDLLDDTALRRQGYLNADLVTRTWRSYKQGDTRHAYRLWTVLMFQAWLARWG